MNLKLQLKILSFLQFCLWGSWLTTLGSYMFVTLKFDGAAIGAVYSSLGIAAVLMPTLLGIVVTSLFLIGLAERREAVERAEFAFDAALAQPHVPRVRHLLEFAIDHRAIEPGEARELCELGERIKRAAIEQLPVSYPGNPDMPGITNLQFMGPLERVDGVLTARNTVVVSPGRCDRSPCGTGTSARMAQLHARGELPPPPPELR